MRYLPPPELPGKRHTVLPVFIPFAGCPGRCIYCAQHLQTRQAPATRLCGIQRDLDVALSAAQRLAADGQAVELAFYGGTFTLLPAAWQEELLGAARPFKECGVLRAVRCSTRPDAVPVETLHRLKALGLDAIELGVQSFAAAALARSGRGYDGEAARAACHRVREQGFTLGVQLLPGLPGMTEDMFQADVDACLDLSPDLVRLYPCLVLQGTPLAQMWAEGGYQPWSLARTVPLLAEAMLKFQRGRIRVARIGLPLGDGLAEAVLAGPAHPALGDMVRGLALYYWLKEQITASAYPVRGLSVPHAWQGAFWGHQGELKPAYAALGLSPTAITFWDWPLFCLKG